MRKSLLIISGIGLLLLTMCEPGIQGPGRPQVPELEPGLFTASMDLGSVYLAKASETNSENAVNIVEDFTRAPVSGDLEGAFEGSISTTLNPDSRDGYHRGTGLLKLANEIVFEVEISGMTVDAKDSGYLTGSDRSNRYKIDARYSEENGSHRGGFKRPLTVEGNISELRYRERKRGLR